MALLAISGNEVQLKLSGGGRTRINESRCFGFHGDMLYRGNGIAGGSALARMNCPPRPARLRFTGGRFFDIIYGWKIVRRFPPETQIAADTRRTARIAFLRKDGRAIGASTSFRHARRKKRFQAALNRSKHSMAKQPAGGAPGAYQGGTEKWRVINSAVSAAPTCSS